MKTKRVALLIESSRTYGRGLLYGIAQYAQAHGHWATWHHERSLGEELPLWMQGWQGDGIMARIDSPRHRDQIKALGIPTVDLRLQYNLEDIVSVGIDNFAVAKLAADHLIERKFEHFACCGLMGVSYARERCQLFTEYLKKRGHEVDVWLAPESPDAPSAEVPSAEKTTTSMEARGLMQDVGLADWIQALPKPVGILAHNDVYATQVLMACQHCGISVPEEVAVIGVDNDPIICELSPIPLTSVQLPHQKIGYQAAMLLDEMMEGRLPDEPRLLLPPTGIATRQSTDIVAISDKETVAAIQFIRENACRGIKVSDIVQHLRISRSTLERRFGQYLNRTLQTEITRIQLRRVQQLLRGTDYSLAKIAKLAGFKHVEYMCKFFKGQVGQTPGEYRKQG